MASLDCMNELNELHDYDEDGNHLTQISLVWHSDYGNPDIAKFYIYAEISLSFISI